MSPTTPDNALPGAAFRRGFVDARPICLGYFGVGFAIAAAAVAGGHPVWSPILQSLTHVSGTSQGAFSHRAIPGPPGGGWELFLLFVGLNLRYVLLALAQKLPEKIGLGRSLLGIAPYAMFVAIVIPAAKASRATLFCAASGASAEAGRSEVPTAPRYSTSGSRSSPRAGAPRLRPASGGRRAGA